MKSARRNKVLGLAIGDRSVLVAEVSSSGDKPEVTRAAEFAYPAGAMLADPGAIGKALQAFLQAEGFTARLAVLGIPAKWVLTKPKDAPPAEPAVVAESLRLQAEGDFSQELKDLVFDYAGETSTSESRPVLLMAVPGRHVEQAKSLAAAAGLNALAVTPSAAALGAAAAKTATGAKGAMVLSVGPGGAEFAAQHGPHPRVLRHLGSAASPLMLAGELRRAAAMMPRGANGKPAADAGGNGTNGTNGTNGAGGNGANGATGANGPAVARVAPARELTIWDGVGLDAAALRAIGEAAGASVRGGDWARWACRPARPRAPPPPWGATSPRPRPWRWAG